MTVTITAFEKSPDGGKGLARDTRVRWALEEVRQPYEVRLLSFPAMKAPAHLGLHPFGQIPTYEDGDLALFETGSIVFHIAECHPGLLPVDPNARSRAVTWIFAALNSIDPPILELANAKLLESGSLGMRTACRLWKSACAPGCGSCPCILVTRNGWMGSSVPGTCCLSRYCFGSLLQAFYRSSLT